MNKYFIIILLLSFTSVSFAQNANENDYIFGIYSDREDNKTPRVYIKEYNGIYTDIIIPSQFEGNYVNEIWTEAFANKGLTSVILPENIYEIGSEAFAWNKLTSIIIPARVMLYSDAFKGNNITRITIGSNVFLSYMDEPSFELGFDEYFIANNRRAGTYTYYNGKWSFEYNVKEDDFEFDIITHRYEDGSEIIIKNYKGSDTDIKVPGYFLGSSIDRIGKNAFAGKGLTSIILPENSYNIDEGAFANNELTDVIIPELVYISDKAFADNKITSVTFKGKNDIYASTFHGNNITRIDVGKNVGIHSEEEPAFELGFDDFFKNNKKRAGIYVYQDGSWKVEYDIIENGFAANISDDGKSVTILDYFGSDTVITIPSKMGNLPVTTIGYWAFYKKGLTNVTIPDSVTAIHKGAFAENKLTNVIIPDGVININEKAFYQNEINNLKIAESVTVIGRQAFAENFLTSVNIPDTVKTIWWEAFAKNKLTSINIPAGIDSIYYGVFSGNNLKELIVPDNIKNIGKEAFANNELTSMIIPNSITYIGEEAFVNNRLTEIIIPDSVTEIENKAFIGNNIKSVLIPSSITRMGKNIFDDTVKIEYAPENEKYFNVKLNNTGGVTITGYTGKKTEIVIPSFIDGKPVTEIREYSLQYKKFNSIVIPDYVIVIESKAFYGNKLTEITIPHSVGTIGYEGFARNPITKITIGALVRFGKKSFDNNFFEAYYNNDRKAGTYLYADENWNYYGTEEENKIALELTKKRHYYPVAIASDPWNFLGYYHYNEGRYEDSVKAYDEAIIIVPVSEYLWLMRGLSYVKLEKYDKAIENYTEAIRLKPDYALAYYNRAVAYESIGRSDLALLDIEKALEINPNNETYKSNLNKLKSRINQVDK